MPTTNSILDSRPSVFGDYELVTEVGRGSTATVFSARRGPDPVALKIFAAHASPQRWAQLRDYFEMELGIIRSMDHPNIVKLIDAGVVDGVPFIAMELKVLEAALPQTQPLNSTKHAKARSTLT